MNDTAVMEKTRDEKECARTSTEEAGPCGETALGCSEPESALKDEGKGASGHNKELGERGERAAVRFLERRGYEILERNWTCSAGEADIIATDEDTLIFIEVKTRSNLEHGLPEEAVDEAKRRRYERIAAYFLKDYDGADVAVRFDVVSILAVSEERAFLKHHINAFACGE